MNLYGANGKPVDADEHGRALTRGIVEPAAAEASRRGKMFSVTSTYTTGGADEEVIYLKNTHATDAIEVDTVTFGSAVNAKFTIAKVTGTAGGASAATIVNMNTGSTKTASASASGNASVTGLTIGDTIIAKRILANTSFEHPFAGFLTLAPNTAIAVTNSGTGACDCTIFFHFNNLEGK